jgi:hypothetical protein
MGPGAPKVAAHGTVTKMIILSFVVLGVSAAIAYYVGIERVGREYDTNSRRLHAKAARARARASVHAA